MATMQVESTEYIYIGVTGTPPTAGAEVAFMPAAQRPSSGDWVDALVVDDDQDTLWADAQASGVTGDYYLARLVGPFGDNDVVLEAGDYQVWVRLTDTVEQPVRIADTLEVLGS